LSNARSGSGKIEKKMVFPVRKDWHAQRHIAPLSGDEKADPFLNAAGTGGRADLCFRVRCLSLNTRQHVAKVQLG
jgi:hypothetical protein